MPMLALVTRVSGVRRPLPDVDDITAPPALGSLNVRLCSQDARLRIKCTELSGGHTGEQSIIDHV